MAFKISPEKRKQCGQAALEESRNNSLRNLPRRIKTQIDECVLQGRHDEAEFYREMLTEVHERNFERYGITELE